MSDDNSDISGDNSDINILFKNFLDVITSSPAHVNSATPPLDSSPSRSKMMSNDNSDGSGDNSDSSSHNRDISSHNSDISSENSDINVRFKNFLDVITSSPATPPLDSS